MSTPLPASSSPTGPAATPGLFAPARLSELDLTHPAVRAITGLFLTVKEDLEDPTGGWNGADTVELLTEWFTKLGIDVEHSAARFRHTLRAAGRGRGDRAASQRDGDQRTRAHGMLMPNHLEEEALMDDTPGPLLHDPSTWYPVGTPAYQEWHCGRCNTGLCRTDTDLVCEVCGSRYHTENGRYLGARHRA